MGTQNPAEKHFCIGMTCGGVYYGKRLFVPVFRFTRKNTPIFHNFAARFFKTGLRDYRAQ